MSPRAYDFVRCFFNKNLPHESTIRGWYANCNLSSEPGINRNIIDILKSKQVEAKKSGKELILAIFFDEIHIRKHLQWCHSSKTMMGYTTCQNNDDENKTIASQSLVFMVSDLNSSFRVPVSYHFISALKAEKKKDVLFELIEAIEAVGIRISSITFDGYSANIKMCKLLGANLDVYDPNFQSHFIGPDGKPIYIFFDPSHMIKLVRNNIAKKKVLIGEQNEIINWSFFQNLVEFKNENEFITHKLNQKHMQWSRSIMRVKLAVETLSESAASSMEFLKNKGYDSFAETTETIKFVRMFDSLFNVFNSKHEDKDNIYKRPLCVSNKEEIFQFLDQAAEYIKNIQFIKKNGSKAYICVSRSKVPFIGFITNIQSLKNMFTEYVEDEHILPSIRTQAISQDHIEQLFSQIRSMNGFNDNPTIEQFSAAFRKLLVYNLILISKDANVQSPDSISESNIISNILTVPKQPKKQTNTENSHEECDNMDENSNVSVEELEQLEEKLQKIENETEESRKNNLKGYSIKRIAYNLENKIKQSKKKNRFYCNTSCLNVFDENDKCDDVYYKSNDNEKPCLSTITICEITDRFMKLELLDGSIKFETILYAIFQSIHLIIDSLYPKSEFSCDPNHKLYLIRCLVDEFINVRCNYIAHKGSLDIHDKFLRSQFHKLIHFNNQ